MLLAALKKQNIAGTLFYRQKNINVDSRLCIIIFMSVIACTIILVLMGVTEFNRQQ